MCCVCQTGEETTIHALRDCPEAAAVWRAIVPGWTIIFSACSHVTSFWVRWLSEGGGSKLREEKQSGSFFLLMKKECPEIGKKSHSLPLPIDQGIKFCESIEKSRHLFSCQSVFVAMLWSLWRFISYEIELPFLINFFFSTKGGVKGQASVRVFVMFDSVLSSCSSIPTDSAELWSIPQHPLSRKTSDTRKTNSWNLELLTHAW